MKKERVKIGEFYRLVCISEDYTHYWRQGISEKIVKSFKERDFKDKDVFLLWCQDTIKTLNINPELLYVMVGDLCEIGEPIDFDFKLVKKHREPIPFNRFKSSCEWQTEWEMLSSKG